MQRQVKEKPWATSFCIFVVFGLTSWLIHVFCVPSQSRTSHKSKSCCQFVDYSVNVLQCKCFVGVQLSVKFWLSSNWYRWQWGVMQSPSQWHYWQRWWRLTRVLTEQLLDNFFYHKLTRVSVSGYVFASIQTAVFMILKIMFEVFVVCF